jgi:hypothetical protein
MNNRKVLIISIALLLLTLSVGLGVFQFNKQKRDEVNLESKDSSFETVKKQVKTLQKKYKNSKLAVYWYELKFDKIEELFLKETNKKMRVEHLQNLIYLHSLGDNYQLKDPVSFHQMLNRVGQKILMGNDIIFIEARLFLNLVNQLESTSAEIFDMLKELRKKNPEERIQEMLFESFVLAHNVEYVFKTNHIKRLQTEMHTQQDLVLLGKYRDQQVKKEITQIVFDFSLKATPLQQALILKYLIHHPNDFRGDLRSLINQVAKNKDEFSYDALLSAIQRLGLQGVYKSEIEGIESRAQSVFIKQLAKEALATIQFVGEQ